MLAKRNAGLTCGGFKVDDSRAETAQRSHYSPEVHIRQALMVMGGVGADM